MSLIEQEVCLCTVSCSHCFFVASSHSATIFGLVQMGCIENTQDRAILGAQQGDAVLEVFLQLNV